MNQKAIKATITRVLVECLLYSEEEGNYITQVSIPDKDYTYYNIENTVKRYLPPNVKLIKITCRHYIQTTYLIPTLDYIQASIRYMKKEKEKESKRYGEKERGNENN